MPSPGRRHYTFDDAPPQQSLPRQAFDEMGRRTSADARSYAVKLTDDGWRVLQESRPLVKAVDEQVLASLPEARREPFLGNLQSVIEKLEQARQ
jgi:hypothetical protein